MTDIRYGIIGSGMMGQEHIRTIGLLEGARVTAVCDPDEGMRSSAAHMAGGDCAEFSDHKALLQSGLCDALVIAAPNHLHHRILKDVLPADLPILVEKPLCTTLADCEEILKLAGGRMSQVWVAMEYRYIPPVQRLIEAVHSGETGVPRMISIREHRFPFLKKVGDWNRFEAKTGGTLVEKCCHFFDLMRLIAKAEPVRVYASGNADVNFRDEDYDGRARTFSTTPSWWSISTMACAPCWIVHVCRRLQLAGGNRGDWRYRQGRGVRAGAVPVSPDGKERHSEFVLSPRATKREEREIVDVDAAILAAGDHHGSTFFQHQKFLEMIRNGGCPRSLSRMAEGGPDRAGGRAVGEDRQAISL
jgi:myo-inositol 2-dehydrogenase/D-chiro-inositol 1-dehydrogenase